MKILGCVSLVGLAILAMMWQGFVLSKLWLWFVVPFFGAPTLGVAQAIGLALMVHLLTAKARSPEEESPWNAVGFIFFLPAITLLVGYIVHLCL